MNIKTRIIRYVIAWLCSHYPFIMLDAVIGPGYHKHKDPTKKRKKPAREPIEVNEGAGCEEIR